MSDSQQPVWSVGLTDRLIRALAHLPVVRQRASYIAFWLNRPKVRRRKLFDVPFRGLRYQGEIDNRIDWRMFFLPDYLAPELDLIERARVTMRPHGDRFVCYDIGANIGHITMAMATIADDVVAFEPSPYALARLRDRVRTNRLSNVRSFNLGLDETEASTKFDILDSRQYYAKKSNAGPVAQVFGQFDATMKRGDDVIEQKRLPLPSFIRINAADEYLNVLRGLKRTLAAASPIILIELPAGYRRTLGEGLLRDALYPNVDLFGLDAELGSRAFNFAHVSHRIRRLLCLPDHVMRLAEQELAKMRSLKMACR